MTKRCLKLGLVAVLLTFMAVGSALADQNSGPGKLYQAGQGGGPEDEPSVELVTAVPNLSFPIIMTDYIQMFFQQTWVDKDLDGEVDANEWVLDYDLDDDGIDEMTQPTPIEVEEVISDTYSGTYPGNEEEERCVYILDKTTSCALDWQNPEGTGTPENPVPDGELDDLDLYCEDMVDWIVANEPWYDQPVYYDGTLYDNNPNNIWDATIVDTSENGGANSWQADWLYQSHKIYIEFIDWGNPLENINPVVGQRFPVEVALYELLDVPMTAYGMACLEYPGTKIELFGTSTMNRSDYTYRTYFATVLTNLFIAEVDQPNGITAPLEISPGIGPSGKMNFASGSGGWIPEVPGWHRIWFRVTDPLITLEDAIVNNDEHYMMTTGCFVQPLNPNKLELTGIVGNSVYIDIFVEPASGGG